MSVDNKEKKFVVPSSDEIREMDRISALVFFGLREDATDYLIEEKYWQYIKRFRVDRKSNADILDRINAVYQIASGKEVSTTVDSGVPIEKKKFDIKNYIYYSWWKYALGLLAVFVAFLIVKQVFFTPAIDFRVVALGHFQNSGSYMEDLATERLEYKNPFIGVADIIADNSEQADGYSQYGTLAASAFLSTGAEVIITDSKTTLSFLAYMLPMDDFYARLEAELSEEQLSRIVPIYYSLDDHYEHMKRIDQNHSEDEVLPEPGSDVKHIYGILIQDAEFIRSVGFDNRWRSQQPSLVLSFSNSESSRADAEEFIYSIISDYINDALVDSAA